MGISSAKALTTGARRAAARLALAAAVSLAAAEGAGAETLRCEVPPAPVCEACVAKLALTVRSDGSCRADWIDEPAPEGDFVQAPMTVEITIEEARAVPIPRKAEPVPAIEPPMRSPRARRCFVYQHQRFCE